MIYCEFTLCVYNKTFFCELNEIEIASNGLCKSCVVPIFPKELLEEIKDLLKKQLS